MSVGKEGENGYTKARSATLNNIHELCAFTGIVVKDLALRATTPVKSILRPSVIVGTRFAAGGAVLTGESAR